MAEQPAPVTSASQARARSSAPAAATHTSAAAAAASAAAIEAAKNRPQISVTEQHVQIIKTLFVMQQEGQLCDVHFVLHADADTGAASQLTSAGGAVSFDTGSLDCDVNMAAAAAAATTMMITNAAGERIVRIPAHRAVLAASSSYFRSLFTSSMIDASSSEIDLPGVRSPAAFRLMLEFLYTGKIAATGGPSAHTDEVADSIVGVLELADLYAIESLHTACITFLRQRITVTNCVHWLQFAKHLPSCTELYQTCLAFFCRHACL